MPTAARQLLRVVLGPPDVPDGDLLARFVAARDEEAFTELVRRHGSMVLAVCRRVTGRPHDAEDAFQAAFLVLARRAAHLTRPELLANWLYGVACRTALDARAARRRAERHAVSAAPEPAAPEPPADTADLRQVIDEELAALPDKYRAAVVLCDLEGLPRAAAAQQLGIPEGTLSSRLAHARKLLACKLMRRGLTASAAAIASALGAESAAAPVPHTLTKLTSQLAARFAAGTVPAGAPPAVFALTDGALKAMFVSRLRQMFAVGLLACGLTGVGVALAQQYTLPAPDVSPLNVPQAAVYEPDEEPAVVTAQPKKAEPKKVAAKGIEDDEVPYGSFPAQAVVRIEDGKLVVRQRGHSYQPVAEYRGNAAVVSYQAQSAVTARTHDPADVAVFDMKGNRLSPKVWKEMLKTDVHALVAYDGKLPNPRELTLFKPDALLVVLPAPAQPEGGFNYRYPTEGGSTFVVPSTTLPAPPRATAPMDLLQPARPSAPPRPTAPRLAPPAGALPPTVESIPPAAPAFIPGQNRDEQPPLELPRVN